MDNKAYDFSTQGLVGKHRQNVGFIAIAYEKLFNTKQIWGQEKAFLSQVSRPHSEGHKTANVKWERRTFSATKMGERVHFCKTPTHVLPRRFSMNKSRISSKLSSISCIFPFTFAQFSSSHLENTQNVPKTISLPYKAQYCLIKKYTTKYHTI